MLDRPLLIIAIIAIAVFASSRLKLWILRHLVLINTRLSDFNQFIKLTNYLVFHKKKLKGKNNIKCRNPVLIARFKRLIKR